eukprot:scaffold171390_cov32-Tisochrysis_lutea.AAC.2
MGRRTSEPDKPLPNDAKRKKTTGEQALDHTHFRQTCRRPEHLINGFFFSLLLKVGNTIDFMLKPEECKADIDKIMRNIDQYTMRNAAMSSDDTRHNANEVWLEALLPTATWDVGLAILHLASLLSPFLRYFSSSFAVHARHGQSVLVPTINPASHKPVLTILCNVPFSLPQLHCHGMSFERGAAVTVIHNGQPIVDEWTITAMNAVEATLRASDGSKLKVTLSQLRNGRYALKPRS